MKRLVFQFLVSALVFAQLSCQQKPTRTLSENRSFSQTQNDWVQSLLSRDPVIVDARSFVDFGISHPPGAINVRWEDFARPEKNLRGMLLDDKFSIARRLALMGIDPWRPILVVGYGKEGKGEDGRLAWMFKYLGIKEVGLTHISQVRSTIPRPESTPMNRPVWIPELNERMEIGLEEFRIKIKNNRGLPKSAQNISKAVVLDVRPMQIETQNQYDLGQMGVEIPVLKQDWRNFLNDMSQPRAGIESWLLQNQIDHRTEILVLGGPGLEAGVVSYALYVLGYNARRMPLFYCKTCSLKSL